MVARVAIAKDTRVFLAVKCGKTSILALIRLAIISQAKSVLIMCLVPNVRLELTYCHL